MNIKSISSPLSVTILVLLTILPFFSTASEEITFDLIHRDSPLSPFYDPSSTYHDNRIASFNRSQLRRQMFTNNNTPFPLKRSVRSHLISYAFEFLMKVNVGTPPVTLFLIADTGSDLTWVKSLPCTKCSTKGRYVTYNPKISGSYRPVSCKSSACLSSYAGGRITCGTNNSCPFELLYGDSSQSAGELGFETMGLGSSVLRNIIFGLAHTLNGLFPGSGIVGLGAGPLSLVRQMGNSIGAKFSYCLGNANSIGKISFGDKSIPTGPNVVTTPMVFVEPDTYYYLTINSFTIGTNGKKIQYGVDGVKGNIIIDSGTTLTNLPSKYCDEINKSYMEQIKAEKVKDPTGTLDFCYKTNNVDTFPPMTIHLDGGVELVVPPTNMFVAIVEGVWCLTILPIEEGGVSVYGNLWQETMVVGYDLVKKQMHFKPGGCPKY
ncbi:aspartic proteinase CDR1-like [Impatiens glandulifera]|uniref:aspartic proteinase CDR1-like n=1 Tax=Impatiens glandulifera TaxID=253017 RepID=UPI001FB178A6|nr:aspartic proteinase CDR1-like [Impatiens glandulifera]